MKKLLLITACIIMPTMCLAQQPPEYILKVTPAEVDLISKGLGTQPFNDVVPVINKLRSQVLEQQAQAFKNANPEPAKPVENKIEEPKN